MKTSKLKNLLNKSGNKVKPNMADKISQQLQQVKDLLLKGAGRPAIARALGITEHKAMKLMKEAKTETLPVESKNEIGMLEIVTDMVNNGKSEIQIAKELNITVNSAVYWCQRARAGSTKYSKVDGVRGLLDQGYETYDVAKAYKSSLATTIRLVKQAENKYDPVKDWVLKAAKTGILFSELKKSLNISSVEKAKEILKENFPDCFVVETKLEKDTFLIPVYSSAMDIEWLAGPNKNKRFEYYVSPEKNYMYIKVDDNLPEDTIEIYNISDVHIGSRAHVSGLYKDLLDIIQDNPNSLAGIGGDMGTFNHRTSVADPMDQYLRNTEQMLTIVKSVKRISHKVIDWVGSNHDDDRTDRVAQVKPGEIMANMTAVPFFAGQVIIDIEWRGVRKTILHSHNLGKAFSETAILEAVKKTCSSFGFMINAVLLGHTHNGFRRRIETRGKTLGRGMAADSTWILNAGACEGRTGSWVEKEGLSPAPQDIVYYSIREDGKDWATEIPVNNI